MLKNVEKSIIRSGIFVFFDIDFRFQDDEDEDKRVQRQINLLCRSIWPGFVTFKFHLEFCLQSKFQNMSVKKYPLVCYLASKLLIVNEF